MAKTKKYVLTGKHVLADGKVMRPGSSINLTKNQAANMEGKIVDPDTVLPSGSFGNEELEAEILQRDERIKALELENEDLKRQLNGENADEGEYPDDEDYDEDEESESDGDDDEDI